MNTGLAARDVVCLHVGDHWRTGGVISMDAVIVTYNSAGDLRGQLACEPLRAAFRRIVVVDNASSDGSPAVAQDAGVEVVRRGSNDSLSAAVNEGARRMDGELFAVLNPDVVFDDPATVRSLAGQFTDPSVGAVGPALRLPDGRLQDSARAVPTPTQLAARRLLQRELGAVHSEVPVAVDWVVSAFLVVRRRAFEDVGGFDERYRLYFEDVDFCVRLWSRGWTVRLDPTTVVRHEHQADSRRSPFGRAFREHVRSAGRFFASHPDLLLSTGRGRLTRPTH